MTPKYVGFFPFHRGIMWPSLVKIRFTELKLLCGNLCGRPPTIPNHIMRPVSRRAHKNQNKIPPSPPPTHNNTNSLRLIEPIIKASQISFMKIFGWLFPIDHLLIQRWIQTFWKEGGCYNFCSKSSWLLNKNFRPAKLITYMVYTMYIGIYTKNNIPTQVSLCTRYPVSHVQW